ncbi:MULTISPECIES: hypothetical protein [unclassified Microbacterium]|uniref:hypothetical protein n=1 Tax=unclassified Microbacterium TaxID=2609290 RepID=UPI0030191250
MSTRGLSPDVSRSIAISAVMSRNKYADDTASVIAELYATAGDRLDLLAQEVGCWVGYYEDDYTRTLASALRALPLELDEHIALGTRRRQAGTHTTPRPTA